MTKFEITISREDDETQGLAPIATIIQNGLSCIVTDVTVEPCTNAVTISFDADPESIEATIEQFWTDEDTAVMEHAQDEANNLKGN